MGYVSKEDLSKPSKLLDKTQQFIIIMSIHLCGLVSQAYKSLLSEHQEHKKQPLLERTDLLQFCPTLLQLISGDLYYRDPGSFIVNRGDFFFYIIA